MPILWKPSAVVRLASSVLLCPPWWPVFLFFSLVTS